MYRAFTRNNSEPWKTFFAVYIKIMIQKKIHKVKQSISKKKGKERKSYAEHEGK